MRESFTFQYSKHLPTAKYIQLADALCAWLSRNRDGISNFPSDRQLSKWTRVTTNTVNKAVNILVQRGLLKRTVGSGTRICHPGEQSAETVHRRIGVFCHETINVPEAAWTSPTLNGISVYALEHGYQVHQLVTSPANYLEEYRNMHLAGAIILSPSPAHEKYLEELEKADIPFYILGAMPQMSPYCFGIDDAETMKKTMEYLYELGHRKIGFLSTDPSYRETDAGKLIRQRTYAEMMWKYQLPVNPAWFISWPNTPYQELLEKFRALRNNGELPSAYILGHVTQSIELYKICNQLNIRIPEELSIISFDDPAYASALNPPLTVWQQYPYETAQQATAALLNRIAGKKEPGKTITPTLVIRNSCCSILHT